MIKQFLKLIAGTGLICPLLLSCQGQMRDQISYRAMEAPLDVPAEHVAMSDEEVNLDFPDYPGVTGGPSLPDALNSRAPGLGKQKYEAQCAPCHGNTGAGYTEGKVGQVFLPPPPPLNDPRFKAMSDGQLYLRIAKGGVTNGAAMPAYAKKLTIEERWAVVRYLKEHIAK